MPRQYQLYQTFKEEMILTLKKLFHKIKAEIAYLNLFYEARVTLVLKAVKVKVTQSCLTLCDPMESMEFSRPEYWSG